MAGILSVLGQKQLSRAGELSGVGSGCSRHREGSPQPPALLCSTDAPGFVSER